MIPIATRRGRSLSSTDRYVGTARTHTFQSVRSHYAERRYTDLNFYLIELIYTETITTSQRLSILRRHVCTAESLSSGDGGGGVNRKYSLPRPPCPLTTSRLD